MEKPNNKLTELLNLITNAGYNAHCEGDKICIIDPDTGKGLYFGPYDEAETWVLDNNKHHTES